MNYYQQLQRIPFNEFRVWNDLLSAGYETYLVGGAVRDIVLGKQPKDWDFATAATPDQIKEVFNRSDFKVDLVGATFGVVIVNGIEVATFRGDKYHGGGDKDVTITYVDSIAEDLKRRDFTFNAMALSMNGKLFDPHNGLQDLNNNEVKFVGDPNERIKEDPNRIFRALRFAAVMIASIEENSFFAIKNNAHLVKTVAPERIRLEILKVLSDAKVPSYFWYLALRADILDIIFPELAATYGHDHGNYHNEDIWTHSMVAGDHVHKKFPLLRLAALLHDIGKVPAYNPEDGSFHDHQKLSADVIREWMTAMKFTVEETRFVVNLALAHMDGTRFMTAKARRRLKNKLGRYGLDWREWLRVRIADRAGNLKRPNFRISDIKQYINHFVIEEEVPFNVNSLALKGGEIIDAFDLKPGPLVGEIQRELLEFVLENGVEFNNKENLLTLADGFLKLKKLGE